MREHDDIFTFTSEKGTPVDPEVLDQPVSEGRVMKIKLSELRRIIHDVVLTEARTPPPGFIRPTSREEWESIYSDTWKSLYGRRPGDLSDMSDEELEDDLYALFDEESSTTMDESDDDDQDDDGDADFADVMMSRMMASGMSKADAKKKTRKHDE